MAQNSVEFGSEATSRSSAPDMVSMTSMPVSSGRRSPTFLTLGPKSGTGARPTGVNSSAFEPWVGPLGVRPAPSSPSPSMPEASPRSTASFWFQRKWPAQDWRNHRQSAQDSWCGLSQRRSHRIPSNRLPGPDTTGREDQRAHPDHLEIDPEDETAAACSRLARDRAGGAPALRIADVRPLAQWHERWPRVFLARK